jgi:catechol 2,3-dioxygenase-like lactoylglutathione lyase family enzyme
MSIVTGLGALVLFTADLDRSVKFYRALGIPIDTETHDDGPPHSAADVGGTHFAIYEGERGAAPPHRRGGCTFPGFTVESVADSLAAARPFSRSVIQEPEYYPWGLRCVLEDPDGRPIEIYEPAPPQE